MSLGFAVLSVVLAFRLVLPDRIPPLRLSAGPEGTRRHAVAEMLAQHAAKDGLRITISTNAGSEESLQQLKAGELDAAIVSNGVIVPHDDQLTVIAVTQLETIHFLVRKEIADSPVMIDGIRGKRINLGEPGSTDALLSREILRFARLNLPTAEQAGDLIATEYGKPELLAKCRAIKAAGGAEKERLIGELPDALILLDSPPSALAQRLIEAADYRISPLPATRAFLLDNLQDDSDHVSIVQREFLEQATIPRHSYFAHRGLPESDCETVGARLLLVARKDAPASAVQALMATLFNSELTHRLGPLSPRDVANPYPIHDAALAYLDRDKPVAIDSVLDWLSNCLSIFGAFSAGALSLYSILRTRSARGPSDYYDAIHKIEQLAQSFDPEAANGLPRSEYLRHLDDRLAKLRQDLIEDICEGRIKGEQLILSILTLLKDARENLHGREFELTRAERPFRAAA
jgi:TRAP-type uncharacterized transport system substrate-binding protein